MSAFTDFIGQITKNAPQDLATVAQGLMGQANEVAKSGGNPVTWLAQNPQYLNPVTNAQNFIRPYAQATGAQLVPADPGKGILGKQVEFDAGRAKQNLADHPVQTALTAASVLAAIKAMGNIENAGRLPAPPENTAPTQSTDQQAAPQSGTDTTTMPKKNFFTKQDPINQIEAPRSDIDPKAYSKTTPNIKAAYARNGITNPDQVYVTQQGLYDKVINPTLANDTTTVALGSSTQEGIVPQIVSEMKRMDPSLDDNVAMKAASGNVNNLRSMAVNQGDINAANLQLKDVLTAKTKLNGSLAVQNYYNGNLPTTPQAIADVATRNVLQNVLEQHAPTGITQAVKDYGLLEEGFGSYKEAFQNPAASGLAKIWASPWVKGGAALAGITEGQNALRALGTLGGSAIGAVESGVHNIAKKAAQSPATQQQEGGQGNQANQVPNQQYNNGNPVHINDLPTAIDKVQAGSGVPSPSQVVGNNNLPLGLSTDDLNYYTTTINNQIESLHNEMAQNPANQFIQTTDGQKIQALQTRFDSYKTLANNADSQKLYAGYNYVNQLNGSIKDALTNLNAANPNVLNLNSAIENMRKQLEPQYASFAQDLANVESLYKTGNVGDAKTKEAVTAVLNKIQQTVAYNYMQSLQTYGAGSNITGAAAPTGTPTGLPPIPQATNGLPQSLGPGMSISGPSSRFTPSYTGLQ